MFLHFEQIWANIIFHTRRFLSCIYLTDNCVWKFGQSFLVSLEQNSYISIKRLRNVFAHMQSINSVVWTRGSNQSRRIIRLENLKVPLKM